MINILLEGSDFTLQLVNILKNKPSKWIHHHGYTSLKYSQIPELLNFDKIVHSSWRIDAIVTHWWCSIPTPSCYELFIVKANTMSLKAYVLIFYQSGYCLCQFLPITYQVTVCI